MAKTKNKGERENGIRAGFTLVELLVAVSIIAVLSLAAYIGIQGARTRAMNERMADDLSSIVNALEQYKQDYGKYPLPPLGANKNILCFGEDLSYAHGSATDCSSALFMQAQIDNTLLTKRYLQEVPVDPRTGSRYAYGVTADGKYYQVAGNFEESDGTWTARTAGNVSKYPFLTSLIRAYNGPDFVTDGEGWLPYSPDHLAITATLTDITGSVKVDGNDVTDGAVVRPGSMVTAAPGASVTLYFSDGSITYLDGTTDPMGASLRVLPTTAVEQNDKDGIITKIRLKIFSGKIWNKVIRLASESEFNVETTSAIAGVRGTEFGITAKNDPSYPELIVLSGTVMARRKDGALATGTGPEDYLDIDFMNAYESNQAAHGDGTFDHAVFSIPSGDNAMSSSGATVSPTIKDEIIQKYYTYTLGLSHADTPYIVKAVSKMDGTYTLYIAFNGFEDDGVTELSGFEIYGNSQKGEGLRSVSQKALGHPLVIAENIVYSPADKAYTFIIDSKTSPGNPLNKTGKMESIMLRAFRHLYGKTVYSQLSWPPIGLVPNDTSLRTYEFDNSQVYQEFFGVAQVQTPAVCGDSITAGAEQCDDGNYIELDACDNACNLTNILVYTDFGGMLPSATPDYVEGTITANPDGNITWQSNGMKLDPTSDAFIRYTNSTWPNLQKGSMEFIVHGSDLKALPGQEFYLFDMQEQANTNTLDKRMRLLKKTTNILEFNIREQVGVDLIAKTSISELQALPDGELKIQVIWNVNAANDPDKAILKIFDGNNNILTKNNVVPNTNPNLGLNTTGNYDFFIGSKISGLDNTQLPGLMRSFIIKSQ